MKSKNIFVIGLCILLIAVVLFFFFQNNDKNNRYPNNSFFSNNSQDNSKPVLENLGINIEKYDTKTGKAGDFVFSKENLKSNWNSDKIFFEFGASVTNIDGTKVLPELTFAQLDLNTKVKSIFGGKVVEVRRQENSKDYAVSVLYNDTWVANYDHITNPLVQINQQVKAGDTLGGVSTNKDGKTGYFEIMLKEVEKDNSAIYYCPLDFMSSTVKSEYKAKLENLMSDWEKFLGKNIYNQQSQTTAGCVVESIKE